MKKLGVFILFLAVVAAVAGSRWMRLNNPDAIHAGEKTDLYLKEKVSLSELSVILDDSLNAVDDKHELEWAATLLGWKNFQPGHYKIDHGFTYDAFLSKLAKGNQDPISFTIIPGQRQQRILSFLSSNMQFDSLALSRALNDSLFMVRKNFTPESMVAHFFPATYDMYWTLSAEKTLDKIFQEFNRQVLEALQKRIQEVDLTLSEVLVLASIIEGEAIHDDEKPTISGLYWNRLNRGMLLQADPTVNYAVNEQRRLYYKDYEVDHPYNTYQNRGLPPGPINNPSLSAIKAALNPEEHDYLFMVARPNGYHAFTETYAEHQQKSAEWRSYIEEQQRLKEEEG
jgi:UPF0755 protein